MHEGRPGSDSEDALASGSEFGHYLVEQELGEGATGIVYRATDTRSGTTVALKVLRRLLADHPDYLRRFRREAEIAREIRHRHLVAVLDAGEIEGRPFLTACYYRGGSLRERIRSLGTCGVDETVRVAAHVASALDALAERGLVHRDVKPGNVMLDGQGSAALTDFGLARGPAYTVLTGAGQALGTIEYMAPEMIRGEPASADSDIYALGCLVAHCLAGLSPFHAANAFQVAHGHLASTPPDLRLVRPELTAQLAETVVLALAKEPERRPRTATAYAHLLQVAAH